MAGMGEALGLMLAGGAGNAASNRAADIREEKKAQVAAAREQKLAQYKEGLKRDTAVMTEDLKRETNKQTDERRSVENQKDRDSRLSIATMQEAGANSRNAASIAGADRRAELSAGGVDAKTGKRLQGTPTILKDESGAPTGQVLYNFRDGASEIRTLDEIPGGNKPTKAERQLLEADADKYAKQRVGELSGILTSDKEAFKDYGGSRAKATEHFRKEFMEGRGGGGGEEDTPAAPAGNAPVQQQQPAQQSQQGQDITTGMNPTQASLFTQAKAALPDATDEQILQALLSDPRYAKYFGKK